MEVPLATGQNTTQSDLQKTFIAMLFAFAVSVVAQQISELLIVFTNNWKSALTPVDIYDNIHDQLLPLLAGASHLTLALLMLSISWVMWSRSQAAGHREDIERIFSVKFITFLLEVLLVTLYYSLTKSAEGDFSAYAKGKSISSYVTPASAKPEAFQMFWIFFIFALWDVIVDVLKSPKTPTPTGIFQNILSFFTGISVYCAVSILCAGGAILVLLAAPAVELPIHAIAGDVALIATLLLFNQGKVLEYYIVKIFPSEGTRNNTKRSPSTQGNLVILALLLIYALSVFFMVIPCFQK
jgi:hypothetical protein